LVLAVCLFSNISFGDLNQSKDEIIDFINKGQTESAANGVNQIIERYSKDSFLAESLFWIAWSYGWNGKIEEESKLYRKIIDEYSESSIAGQSRMCLN